MFLFSTFNFKLTFYTLQKYFIILSTQMITAYLKTKGKIVQRQKVRRLLSEIDPIGTARRPVMRYITEHIRCQHPILYGI